MLSALQPLGRLTALALLAFGLSSSDKPSPVVDELDPACKLVGDYALVAEVTIDPPGIDPSQVATAEPAALAARPTEVPADASQPPSRPKKRASSSTQRLARVLRVTAYCDRGTTAAGVPSGVGQCAAPAFVPFGSRVYIPALRRTFIVTDRTHKRFRHNTVDIFIPDEVACLQFGRRYLECVVLIDPPATRARQIARFR